MKNVDNAMNDLQMQKAALNAQSRKVGSYGSFLETLANIIAPGVGGAIVNAAEGAVKHVDKTANDGIKDAMAQAGRAVEAIARSESQHSHAESTTTTETSETVQSLTRTFSNPYRDRSLQLRFIPVFRHFEVRTWPAAVKPGISLQVGVSRAVDQAVVRVRDVLADATVRIDASTLQRPLAGLLAGSSEARYASRGAARETGAAASSNAVGALLWSQSEIREDSVLVPLAAPETAATAFGLEGKSRAGFLKSFERVNPEAIARRFPAATQQVHLFIGTHIEAVAGECVLSDVPDAPPLVD
jgi:hypothetical protein